MMKTNMNEYRDCQKQITASDELRARTIRRAEQLRDNMPAYMTKPAHFHWARRTVAAVCALSVLIGGAALWQQRAPGAVAADALAGTFGITAYAVDSDKPLAQQSDSTIVFDTAGGVDDPEKGFFSGCVFRVTGEDIQSVSASLDKGTLYRSQTISLGSDDNAVSELINDDSAARKGADQVMVLGDTDASGTNQYTADLLWKLENGFVDDYDPAVYYGFWMPSQEQAEDQDLQLGWHESLDRFDGVTMKVTVTFTNGAVRTQTLHLHTGRVEVAYPEGVDGPVLTGRVLDTQEDIGTPYVYSVYADVQVE